MADPSEDSASLQPPEDAVVDRSSSPVSAMTTPSSRSSSNRRRDVERINELPLDQLTNNVFSPVKRLDPSEEEERYDRAAYDMNPGADDSEDEEEVQICAAFLKAAADRREHEADNEVVYTDFGEYISSYNEKLIEEAELERQEAEIGNQPHQEELAGAPAGWKKPGPPTGWTPPAPKVAKGEPAEFASVDNPGKWSQYTFYPRFAKGSFTRYALPTGAEPIPEDPDGKRTAAGFEFFYDGWDRTEDIPEYRSGATRDNPFPEVRKGSLSGDVLHRLGLNSARMKETDGAPDSLFFYQLILPVHEIDNKKVLTVPQDPRKSFYPDVASWSNMYATGELRILGSGYGHKFTQVEPSEVLQWDGSVVMDGVLGGSNGAFLRRFDSREGNTSYCDLIAKTFTKSRWLAIKRVYKLCNNLTAKKRDQEGYDPAYKYDSIFETICHNVNALTLFAGLDLSGDETSFPFNGWGEMLAGLFGYVKGKPGMSRGGQTILVSDCDRIRPRAYCHRHRLHPKLFPQRGPTEVRLIWEKMLPLFQPNEFRPTGIFREKPHFTWDNYFSGDAIIDYACEEGFGLTMTCRRDRLPKGIKNNYLCKEKTPVDKRSRAARFQNPIFALKKHKEGYIQLTSFQSTSSCNLISVNALNSCHLYAEPKERGRGDEKRRWGIEMNEARKLYLGTYGIIDKIDHLINNCHMHYRTWKYWHSPMIHAKALAVVVAYDMYLECCEGKLRAGEWKIEKPVDFHRFREKLATQMLQYSPKNRKYPGDEKFRESTQQSVKHRRQPFSSSSASVSTATSNGVTREAFFGSSERLCGDLTGLADHLRSIKVIPNKNKKKCVVCGLNAYHICMKCVGPDGKKGVAMHRGVKEDGDKVPCAIHHHNTAFFGLSRNDHRLVAGGKRKKDWAFPSNQEMAEHAKEVKRVLQPVNIHPEEHHQRTGAINGIVDLGIVTRGNIERGIL